MGVFPIKTLEELFKKLHKVYPHKLVLLKNEEIVISIHEKAPIPSGGKNEYLYPIKSPRGRDDYQLLTSTELTSENLGLLEILINLYLEEIQDLDKKEILQHIANGHWQEDFHKSGNPNFLKEKGDYKLIWIEAHALEVEKELVEMLEECFREDEELTVVPTEEGVFILLEGSHSKEDLLGKARIIRDMVNAELYLDVYIIISEGFSHLKELKNRLKGIQQAIIIGKAVALRSHIYFEDELKIEKTIFAIPLEDRKRLYKEIYENTGLEELEEEAQLTAEAFFKNNLNIGDTSKELFLHRNTLAYRLDRIFKSTGLDLRKFEDAMFYKIAMLLKNSIQ